MVIEANTTTDVHVDVVPWKFDVTTDKDTLIGGGTFDVYVNITQGPNTAYEFLRNTYYFLKFQPWSQDAGGIENPPYKTLWSNATLDVPETNQDTTLYLQFAITLDFSNWDSDIGVYHPALVDGDTLLSFPVVPPSGELNIIFEENQQLSLPLE